VDSRTSSRDASTVGSGGSFTTMFAIVGLAGLTMTKLTPPRRKRRDPMVIQVKFKPLGTYGDFSPETGTSHRSRLRRKGR
jgi:hypothetical protein